MKGYDYYALMEMDKLKLAIVTLSFSIAIHVNNDNWIEVLESKDDLDFALSVWQDRPEFNENA